MVITTRESARSTKLLSHFCKQSIELFTMVAVYIMRQPTSAENDRMGYPGI